MKVGFNTYEQRPQFKASFAKNPQTKQALKTLLEEDFYKLYEIKEALKAAPVKDVIEVSLAGDIAYRHTKKFYRYIFKNTALKENNTAELFHYADGTSNLRLSNDKTLNSYLTEMKDNIPKKENGYLFGPLEDNLIKKAGASSLDKKHRKLFDRLAKLENELEVVEDTIHNVSNEKWEKVKEYIKKDVGLSD